VESSLGPRDNGINNNYQQFMDHISRKKAPQKADTCLVWDDDHIQHPRATCWQQRQVSDMLHNLETPLCMLLSATNPGISRDFNTQPPTEIVAPLCQLLFVIFPTHLSSYWQRTPRFSYNIKVIPFIFHFTYFFPSLIKCTSSPR
jgi:hypothetical protein